MQANKMARLTPNQQEVLDIIAEFIDKNGFSPSVTELARLINASSLRTVTQYLEALEKKGLISRPRHQRRGIKILIDNSHSSVVTLPLVSAVSCGSLTVYAEPIYDEHIRIDRDFLQNVDPKNAVVIKAVGKSMIDANVDDGDLVLAERTKDVHSGDKVIAIIDHMAVLKQLSFTPNAVVLNPMNSDPSYHPIVMKEDFEVFGKMIDVIKHQKNYEITYEPIQEN